MRAAEGQLNPAPDDRRLAGGDHRGRAAVSRAARFAERFGAGVGAAGIVLAVLAAVSGDAWLALVTSLAATCCGAFLGAWCCIRYVHAQLAPVTETLDQVMNVGGVSTPESRQLLDDELASTSDRVLWLAGRYLLLTNNIGAGVIISRLDGRAIYCNPFVQALFGHAPEEFCAYDGDLLEASVVEEDKEQYRRSRMITDLGEPYVTPPYRVRQPSGLVLWIETRLVPVLDEDEEIIGMMGVSVDVTGTVNRQRQIEENNRDLGDFAYMVSHDLKAPIFTIKGMAAALEEDHGVALGEDGRALLRYVVDAASRLERLVASVVEYSAIATKELENESVDLNESMRTVLADLGELIRTRGASVTVEGRLPTLSANAIRIYQVLANLVGNAVKYSDPLRCPVVTVRSRPEPGVAVIEIEDNGRGIPANRLEDIFRPFQRAHGPDIDGSGIGLACVKKIVEKLGGSVTVESVEGRGSTFSVRLPTGVTDARQIPPELVRWYR